MRGFYKDFIKIMIIIIGIGNEELWEDFCSRFK